MIVVEVPMALPSRGNITHAHWGGRHSMAKKQRQTVAKSLIAHGVPRQLKLPAAIRVERIAPDRLDVPNLGQCLKSPIDALAKHMGFNDGDLRVHWTLDQEPDPRGRPKYQAVRFTIASCDELPSPKHIWRLTQDREVVAVLR